MRRLRLPVQGEPCSKETRLTIRTVTRVDGSETKTTEAVFCPFREDSRSIGQCRSCTSFARVENEMATLVCAREPPLDDGEASALIATRQIWSGPGSLARRTPIGALAGARAVCASNTTTVQIAARHIAEAGPAGVVVVDEDGRPAGFIVREKLLSLVQGGSEATLADCETTPFVSLPEEQTLAEAIDQLIRRHLRVIVTVDSSGRANAVVMDLEILRWLARLAHG